MSLLQVALCGAILSLLGVRTGWSARMGLLLPLAALALCAAIVATSQPLAVGGLFLLLNALAQGGFVLGVLTQPRRNAVTRLERQPDRVR